MTSQPVRFDLSLAWIPAVLGLFVICGESTRVMGADHTMRWLGHASAPLANLAHDQLVRLNTVLRKSGHFFGYGMLGVILMQAWFSLLQAKRKQSWSNIRRKAAALGVASVALVASLDELHQHFLPNRTGCVSDVLLDTSGALLLVSIATCVLFLHRRRAVRARRSAAPWRSFGALQSRSLLVPSR